MYVFILWQRQPGVQEEEEEHSMAWRLSLFYTLWLIWNAKKFLEEIAIL